MLKGLSGRTAVVTGAAGAIGQAMCARLAEEGANVVAADVAEEPLRAVVSTLPSKALAVRADITSDTDVTTLISAAVDEFGTVDLVVANAGVECEVHPVAEFSPADFDKVFAVNVKGAFLTAAAAVRRMLHQDSRGKILFTASLAAVMGSPGTSVYNASKHAVLGLARCLALEVGGTGIRVNTLCPGVVDSRMMRSLEDGMGAMGGADGPTIKQAFEAQIPLGRYASPAEVAATAAWILSDEVDYLHGETFTVSGGLRP
ncbi:glucose 1-dehydrogenase [Actinophytocola sp.]|uniref:SDR family NAD(P)-dependent oxidoreductase n=1 Tax=Actinophytocola sp. TaxID=1872138 RepID=UPI002ED64EEA